MTVSDVQQVGQAAGTVLRDGRCLRLAAMREEHAAYLSGRHSALIRFWLPRLLRLRQGGSSCAAMIEYARRLEPSGCSPSSSPWLARPACSQHVRVTQPLQV